MLVYHRVHPNTSQQLSYDIACVDVIFTLHDPKPTPQQGHLRLQYHHHPANIYG